MNESATRTITNITQITLTVITAWAAFYAYRQYKLNKDKNTEDNRPYVFIELDRIVSGLFDLKISNAGKSAAKNVQIKFTPNILLHDYSKHKINSYKFLKSMKFLAAGNSLSFFFGSVMGDTKIKREFQISLKYEDVNGKSYSDEQVIDARDFMDMSHIDKKNIHDVSKNLDAIRKVMEKNLKSNQELIEAVEKGIRFKDSPIYKLTETQLKVMLKNLVNIVSSSEYVERYIREDLDVLSKVIRDRVYSKKVIDKTDKNLLAALEIIRSHKFSYAHKDESVKILKLLG
jgi:hypothetical protein